MNQSRLDTSRVVVLGISEALEAFIGIIKDHTRIDAGHSVVELFIAALRFLHFSHNTREATASMMLDIISIYHPNVNDDKSILRLEQAVSDFLEETHRALLAAGLYDSNDQLNYTLGGWVHEYCPYLVRTTDIAKFSNALPIVVQSQYEIPREYSKDPYWNPAAYLTEMKFF